MCYWYSGNVVQNWAAANQYCYGIGGTLAGTYNKSSLAQVENLITGSLYSTWTGLTKNGTTWAFFDRTTNAYLYQQWAKGEPDSGHGACGAIRKSSDPNQDGYLALGCQYSQPFLCSQKIASCPTQNFTTKTGSLNSPNYPNAYANNELCYYYITANSSNYFVILSFDVWVVEKNYDTVVIYDGYFPGPNAIQMANITIDPRNDTVSPFKNGFQTKSNIMTVIFSTDSIITYPGWKASYRTLYRTDPVYQNGTTGTVTSPNYPQSYPNDVEMYYYVTGPDGFQLQGTFTVFDTEVNRDYLVVYDGPDQFSPVIGNYSGYTTLPPSFITNGTTFTLYFQTDYSVAYKGFSLDWIIAFN
ncbi:unnamed protein product, partial [Mesorhabditis belari]|uniref:Uncharacterized protein n=1 Tax=Mesorhabditis belari TaxID=2138241 RepID=A0AAF3FLS4_9BILA